MQPLHDPSMPKIDAADFVLQDSAAFIRALDLDAPELAPVREALAQAGPESAAHAYMRYFRNKSIDEPLLRDNPLRRFFGDVPRKPAFRTAPADRFLAGHLHDGYLALDAQADTLDWHRSPMPCLTRFPMFYAFLEAAGHTGDPKYARWVIDHGRAYMAAWPIADFAGRNTLENMRDEVVQYPWNWGMIHSRLRIWSSVIQQLRRVPEVTDDELLAIVRRMIEETRFLAWHMPFHVSYKSNAGGTMLLSMAYISAILSDFSEAAKWREMSVKLFARYIETAFYPDGVFKELTVGYGVEVARTMLELAAVLMADPGSEALKPRLTAIVTAIVGMSRPDRTLPPLGDSWTTRIGDGVIPAVADWLGTPWGREKHLNDGTKPPFRDWPPPGGEVWGGYYVMRNGWSDHANYLLVDGGPWGLSHMHCDRLHIVVSAHGRNFLVDPNKTIYNSNLPDAFISMLNAGFLHNTVTVDGVDEFIAPPGWWETASPLGNRWESGKGYTLFCGRFDFRPVKEVVWERRILFADGAYWFLQDVLTGARGDCTLEQNFQFAEDIEVGLAGRRSIATAEGGVRLILMPLANPLQPAISIGDRNQHKTYSTAYYSSIEERRFELGRGWICNDGHKPVPAPAVTYAGLMSLPAVLSTAIIPLAASESDGDLPAIEYDGAPDAATWRLPCRGKVLTCRATLTDFQVFDGAASRASISP